MIIPHMPNVPRRDMWKTKSDTKYGIAADLGRTGMSRHRFDELMGSIRFSEQRQVRPNWMDDMQYRWELVDGFVEAINHHRETNFEPSGLICVDESMICWYGLGGSWFSEGLPHYVAIKRKPENGCEIRDSCCGKTGILCRLKIVKSNDGIDDDDGEDKQQQQNETDTQLNNAGTQAVLDLVGPWLDKCRVVVGDSAFSSVNTCVQLGKRRTGYIGVVKQATKYFPKQPLQNTVLARCGMFVGMGTTVSNSRILAYVWSDRDRRLFVASAGSLARGIPTARIRRRKVGDDEGNRRVEDVLIEVPMPRSTAMYYDAANKIDMHNKVRSECGIERCFGTHDWSIRVNLGILGMLFTDAWLLYSATCGRNNNHNTHTFFAALADDLIDL